MSSQYFPTYSTIRNEIVDVKLNLSEYVTQKELKSLTGNVDTSEFALKTNVTEIKTRVDNIDAEKINIIDELQGKNFVEDSYLSFEPEHRYFEATETDGVLSSKSKGLSDKKIKSVNKDSHPKLSFDKEKIYLRFRERRIFF